MMRYRHFFFLSAALILTGAMSHAQTFTVGNIEGGAEYALPGEEFTPLEGGEKLAPGTSVCTYPESSVTLISDSGSAVQMSENSEMVMGVVAQDKNDSQSSASSKTLLDFYRGRLQYIFNAFSSSGAKDKNDSYFRIRTTSGVAAVAGGSGFVDSEGNFGATSGRLAVLSEAGKILRVEGGEGIRVREGGVLERVSNVRDLPFGSKAFEVVLQLGAYARKFGKLKRAENDLVRDIARKSGLSEDQINKAIHRDHRPRLVGEALRDLRERHREEFRRKAEIRHRKVIKKEPQEKALDDALKK